MKKLLFTRDSIEIQAISQLIAKQKHRTLVLWTIDCAERLLPIFEKKYPQDKRPRVADWTQGKIKMPLAKQATLASHRAATAVVAKDPVACAVARSMGHVVGTVHVETHALGVVIYGLTALVYDNKQKDIAKLVAKECAWFYRRLLYWQNNINRVKITWAPFLLRDDVPNKEVFLRQKLKRSC